jgi:preprotein translocase subunit SecY
MVKIQSILVKSSLLKRLLITSFFIFLVRLGMALPLPGIDNISLLKYITEKQSFITFLNVLSGGSFSTIGLFALNIFPAINASILLEFIVPVIPYLEQLRKEEGEAGEKKLSFYRKLLTLIISIFQSIGIISFLRPFIFEWNFSYLSLLLSFLVTGAMAILWISEILTQKGIANGSSLIIFFNILGNNNRLSFIGDIINSNSLIDKFTYGLFLLSIVFLVVVLQESVRKIPFISAQQLTGESSFYGSRKDTFIPLKLNQAGILPIIFASFIFFIPSYFGKNDIVNLITTVAYYFLIIFFSCIYSAFVWDPKRIADDLKKVSSSIPGIRPGKQTEKYLSSILFRVSFLGGCTLAIILALPMFFQFLTKGSSQPLNISSLIILVGVTLEIRQNIKTLILSSLLNSSKRSLI